MSPDDAGERALGPLHAAAGGADACAGVGAESDSEGDGHKAGAELRWRNWM